MITKVILMNVDANGWMERGRRCVCTSKLAVRWARGGGSVLALPHTPQSHIHNSSIVVRPATETTSPTPVSKGKTPDASLRLSLSLSLPHLDKLKSHDLYMFHYIQAYVKSTHLVCAQASLPFFNPHQINQLFLIDLLEPFFFSFSISLTLRPHFFFFFLNPLVSRDPYQPH